MSVTECPLCKIHSSEVQYIARLPFVLKGLFGIFEMELSEIVSVLHTVDGSLHAPRNREGYRHRSKALN